jgi:hypothetical protein
VEEHLGLRAHVSVGKGCHKEKKVEEEKKSKHTAAGCGFDIFSPNWGMGGRGSRPRFDEDLDLDFGDARGSVYSVADDLDARGAA